MSKYKRVLIGLISVVFLLGGVTMITPLGSEAEGKEKKAKANHKGLQENHKGLQEAHRVLQGNLLRLEGTINAFGEDIEQIKEALPEVDLPSEDATNHTLRWDRVILQPDRLVVLQEFGFGAVLDLETGLVWEKSPETDTGTWDDARFRCLEQAVGGGIRYGWRLPSIMELASLLDPLTAGVPDLPGGHPFDLAFIEGEARSGGFWSRTLDAETSDLVWFANFGQTSLKIFRIQKATGELRAWCVRGGHNDGHRY